MKMDILINLLSAIYLKTCEIKVIASIM